MQNKLKEKKKKIFLLNFLFSFCLNKLQKKKMIENTKRYFHICTLLLASIVYIAYSS